MMLTEMFKLFKALIFTALTATAAVLWANLGLRLACDLGYGCNNPNEKFILTVSALTLWVIIVSIICSRNNCNEDD